MQGALGALGHAVAAGDAARHVHMLLAHIDATGLAVAFAEAAAVTFLLVKDRAEEREVADVAQHRAHGADGVAIGASASPGQYADDEQRACGNGQRDARPHPHVHRIEHVRVVVLGQGGQSVVGPEPEGLHQVGGDAAVGTVRGQDDGQRIQARYHQYQEQQQHQGAQYASGGRVAVLVGQPGAFVLAEQFPLADPCDDVLHDAHRTDDAAVDAPHEERQYDESHDDGHVQGQYGRQELQFGHPSEVGVGRPREVEEEQRDAHPEDDGQCDSDFS